MLSTIYILPSILLINGAGPGTAFWVVLVPWAYGPRLYGNTSSCLALWCSVQGSSCLCFLLLKKMTRKHSYLFLMKNTREGKRKHDVSYQYKITKPEYLGTLISFSWALLLYQKWKRDLPIIYRCIFCKQEFKNFCEKKHNWHIYSFGLNTYSANTLKGNTSKLLQPLKLESRY